MMTDRLVAVDAASKAAESDIEIRVCPTGRRGPAATSLSSSSHFFLPRGSLSLSALPPRLARQSAAAGVNTQLRDREIIRTEREREREEERGNLWGKQHRQLRERERWSEKITDAEKERREGGRD